MHRTAECDSTIQEKTADSTRTVPELIVDLDAADRSDEEMRAKQNIVEQPSSYAPIASNLLPGRINLRYFVHGSNRYQRKGLHQAAVGDIRRKKREDSDIARRKAPNGTGYSARALQRNINARRYVGQIHRDVGVTRAKLEDATATTGVTLKNPPNLELGPVVKTVERVSRFNPIFINTTSKKSDVNFDLSAMEVRLLEELALLDSQLERVELQDTHNAL